jgi:hypothetical protein
MMNARANNKRRQRRRRERLSTRRRRGDDVSTPAPKREEKSSSVWSFTFTSSSRGKVNVFEEFRGCLFQMKESESKMLYYIKRRFALFNEYFSLLVFAMMIFFLVIT